MRTYAYEAFVLTTSAVFFGIIIGTFVAWTYGQQRALFTQMDVPFYFPFDILCWVVLLSVFCAILSSGIPASMMVRNRITTLMRRPAL